MVSFYVVFFQFSYWGKGEPNNFEGHEDCGEIMYYEYENSWNDETCTYPHFWICEKNLTALIK